MTSASPIVHVVDDDDSVRTAVARLLRAAGYEVRVHASAGDFLLSRQPDRTGCVILDVHMPGPSGLEVQEAFTKSGDSMPIVFLTGHGDIPTSVRAIKAGAVDFLTKPVQKGALLSAVESALAHDDKNRSDRAKLSDLRARYEALTPREQAIFSRVTAGMLNKQIAIELCISERTVKAHRSRVMEKLNVQSLAELARIAEQLHTPNLESVS
jgi:FixJ family two-component response regulator